VGSNLQAIIPAQEKDQQSHLVRSHGVPCGKKKKRHKIAAHKRKKKRKADRHKKKKR
jgi:hypothetical protein